MLKISSSEIDPSFSFPDPVYDTSVDSNEVYELRPQGGFTPDVNFSQKGAPVEFYNTSSEFYRPDQVYFKMKIRTTTNVNCLAASEKFLHFVNNIVYCIDKSELRLFNNVKESNQYIGHLDSVLKLLNYSDDYKNMITSLEGFYPNISGIESGDDIDSSLVKSHTQLIPPDASNTVTKYVYIKPSWIGFFSVNNYVNIPFQITLNRGDSNLMYFSTNAARIAVPTFHVDDIKMYVPIVKTNLAKKLKLEAQVSKPYVLNYNTYRIFQRPIASGLASYFDIIDTLQQRPSKIYILFQNAAKIHDMATLTITQNYSNFDYQDATNHSITEMRLIVNNNQNIPYFPYKNDFAGGDYVEIYNQLLTASGIKNNYDSGCCLNYENFKSNYPIFGFNLDKNLSSLPEISSEPCKLELKIDFSGALGNMMYMYVLEVFNTVLQVDGQTGVTKCLFGYTNS